MFNVCICRNLLNFVFILENRRNGGATETELYNIMFFTSAVSLKLYIGLRVWRMRRGIGVITEFNLSRHCILKFLFELCECWKYTPHGIIYPSQQGRACSPVKFFDTPQTPDPYRAYRGINSSYTPRGVHVILSYRGGTTSSLNYATVYKYCRNIPFEFQNPGNYTAAPPH